MQGSVSNVTADSPSCAATAFKHPTVTSTACDQMDKRESYDLQCSGMQMSGSNT